MPNFNIKFNRKLTFLATEENNTCKMLRLHWEYILCTLLANVMSSLEVISNKLRIHSRIEELARKEKEKKIVQEEVSG